jgi:hypothetical protein
MDTPRGSILATGFLLFFLGKDLGLKAFSTR